MILITNINKVLVEKKEIDLATKILFKYYNLLYIFSRKEVDYLPKY